MKILLIHELLPYFADCKIENESHSVFKYGDSWTWIHPSSSSTVSCIIKLDLILSVSGNAALGGDTSCHAYFDRIVNNGMFIFLTRYRGNGELPKRVGQEP